ncbi:MAG TPA: redoxin domain-containing protein, partial [Acidimicrobiales bacterium]
GFNFPVLSDFWPHGAVAKAYGVFNEELGCAIRATFLIDRNGVIVDEFRTDSLGTPREAARYTEALAKL